SRPPNERHFKSTWAAYMLGRSWENENPEKATSYFQKTRELAGAGFADSLCLAGDSLGREARICLRQKNYERAIELYLQQRAEEDDFGEETSLVLTMRDLFSNETDSFTAIAENPLTRRVVTAYMIATRALQTSRANVAAPTRVTRDWLEATDAANVNDAES